jgi:hypothetical protein
VRSRRDEHTATSPDGVRLRCINEAVGYARQVDAGLAAVDPATEGQQAWVKCMQSADTARECANILYGGPPPPTGATAAYIPGKGTLQVGVDIAPGSYESRGGVGGDPCIWDLYATDDSSDIIDSGASIGPQTVMVNAKAGTFETSNCSPWTRKALIQSAG